MTDPSKFSYLKPSDILRDSQLLDETFYNEQKHIVKRMAEIEAYFDQNNMYIRKAKIVDIDNLLELSIRAYSACKTRDLVNAYDLYQSITYSYGLALCTRDNPEKTIGCFFNYAFHANGDKVCNLKRLAVDPDYQHYGLGRYIFEYNQLFAWKKYRSRIQTGLIEYTNFGSLYLMLNKMGGVVDFITDDMTPHFLAYSFVIPLNIDNWKQMEIAQDRLLDFLKGLKESRDYIVFQYNDEKIAREVANNRQFKIAAALQGGKYAEHNSLVAFSNELLNVELK